MKRMTRTIGLTMAVVEGALLCALQAICPGSVGLLLVGGLALLSAGLLFYGLPGRTEYFETFSSDTLWMIISLLGGLGVMGGNGYALVTGSGDIDKIVAMAGIVAGIAICAVAVARYKGEVLHYAIHILPCLSLVVKLIVEFRQWSVDPTIMDYLFRQLAVIAAMAANLHITGYCFQLGKRRTTAFLTLCATIFTGAALVGTSVAQSLVTAGMGLWMFANLGQVLED